MSAQIQTVVQFIHEEKWDDALKMASKLRRIGKGSIAISRAAEALVRPQFYLSLKKNPQAIIEEGKAALIRAFIFS